MTSEPLPSSDKIIFFSSNLIQAAAIEGEKFQEYYLWLENAMPRVFFEEVNQENLILITHSLMGFNLQDYFSTINRKNAAIGLCLDTPDADLRILSPFAAYGIKNYQAYVSKRPIPFPEINAHLRIATIDFTEAVENNEKSYPSDLKEALKNLSKKKIPVLKMRILRAALKNESSFSLFFTTRTLSFSG